MNVMKRAWEIRKLAANHWKCKKMEIDFSECLKKAWAEKKEIAGGTYNVTTNYYKNNHRAGWGAEITGTCEKFGLKREFISGMGPGRKHYREIEMTSRQLGTIHYTLEVGKIYEIRPPYKNSFFVRNNEELTKSEVLDLLKGA